MKFHNTLNPKLWDKWQEKHIGGKVTYHLKKDVAAKLKEIANAFIEYLEVDKEAIKDVVITGSSASFNYTSHSDLDLHLKVDYDLIHEDCPIVEGYLWALKSTFNKDHDISIYGIPVEVYAESIDSDTVHNGLFSLWNMRWIDEPKPIPPTDNDMAVKAKYEEIKEAADRVKDSEVAEQLINKIYEMRKAGLQEVGEFSTENLAFKKLRDAGVLERLKAMKKEKVDKELSLESYNEGLAPATGDLAVFTKRLFDFNLKPDKNFIRQTDYKLDLENADTYIKKDIGYDCPGIIYQIRDKQGNILKEVKWTDIYNTREQYDKAISYLYKYGSMQEIAYVLKLVNPNASEDTITKKLQELQAHRDKSRRIKSHMYFDGNRWQNESIDTDLLKRDEKFRYMMLDRMRQDCNYYLEHPHEKHLWAGNVEEQIETMKQLYNSLPEKPEWITMEDIEDLEKQMLNLKNNKQPQYETLEETDLPKDREELCTKYDGYWEKDGLDIEVSKLYNRKTGDYSGGFGNSYMVGNRVFYKYDTALRCLKRVVREWKRLQKYRQLCQKFLNDPKASLNIFPDKDMRILFHKVLNLYDCMEVKPKDPSREEFLDLFDKMEEHYKQVQDQTKNEDVNTLCDKIDNVEKDLEAMVKLVKPKVLMKNEAYNKLRKVVCEALEEPEFGEFKVGSKVKIGNAWNARQGTITNITNDVATVEIEETPDNMARTDKFYLQDLQLV